MQSTLREGKLVNLPLNLVVKGDIIILKPGQIINVYSRTLKKNKVSFVYIMKIRFNSNFNYAKEFEYEFFENGQIYEPKKLVEHLNEHKSYSSTLKKGDIYVKSFDELCELRKIPDSMMAYALEAPYVKYLKYIFLFYLA
jgi:hypothetical protein